MLASLERNNDKYGDYSKMLKFHYYSNDFSNLQDSKFIIELFFQKKIKKNKIKYPKSLSQENCLEEKI